MTHACDASLIPAGAELAWTLHHLSYRVVYSTTRPPRVRRATLKLVAAA